MLEQLGFAYGEEPGQVADLWPARRQEGALSPVVVVIHGGFWRPGYDRRLMEPLAGDAARRGWATWNLDYRVPGPSGGGWPGTFVDVARGIDHLAVMGGRHALDLRRVAIVGHSAGGCLALWSAARDGLPAGAPGGHPHVRPGLVVSQAGVNDLIAGQQGGLGQGAVLNLMGEPAPALGSAVDPGNRYGIASPAERLPLRVPQVLVHGRNDNVVPLEQTTAYADRATAAGDDVTVLTIDGADHLDLIDPRHRSWLEVANRLTAFFAG